MKMIPLSQGLWATVSDSDYKWLSKWKWYAHWSTTTHSYSAQRSTYSEIVRTKIMAREILGLVSGDPRHADHKNHDTLDNRRSNLRITNWSQSMMNRGKYSSNTSGYKGVYWRRPRNGRVGFWTASIQVNGKRREKGTFKTPEEAYEFYCKWAKELHGEFAWVK